MAYKTESAETELLSNSIICYRLIKELKLFLNEGPRLTYGIEGTDQRGKVRVHISDISTYRSFVMSLIDKCNSCMVSQVHIIDVLEDYLSEL